MFINELNFKAVAGVRGNRTHRARDRRTPAGFEVQAGHQAQSTPTEDKTHYTFTGPSLSNGAG